MYTSLIEQEGPLFTNHSVLFLKESYQRMSLPKKLRINSLIDNEDKIPNIIVRFKMISKVPFLSDVLAELEAAMNIADPVFLSFDAFSTTHVVSKN